MSNFYGGKQGFSFFIVKNYLTIEDMEAAFATDAAVHYNDYVLISDAANPYLPDNGKLYRKGYSEFEYMGKISGPPGGVSEIEFYQSIADLETAYINTEDTDVQKKLPTEIGEIIIDPLQIPGKDGEEFHDNIQYGYFNILTKSEGDSIIGYSSSTDEEDDVVKKEPDDNYNVPTYIAYANPNDLSDMIKASDDIHTELIERECIIKSQLKVALEIPYPVFDLTVSDAPVGVENASIERMDNKEHPFYYWYKLSVPRGIKGDYDEITFNEDTYEIFKQTMIYNPIGGEEGTGGYEPKDPEQGPELVCTLKDESGLLIGLHLGYYPNDGVNIQTDSDYVSQKGQVHRTLVTPSDINTPPLVLDIASIISYLNADFPYGLGREMIGEEIVITNKDLHGKVVAYGNAFSPLQHIGDKDIVEKWFFGFDYGSNNWYYIGSLYSDDTSHNILFDTKYTNDDGNVAPTNGNPLNVGGAWFVIEELFGTTLSEEGTD